MPASLRLLIAWLPVFLSEAVAGTLVINANSVDPAPRAAWQAAVEKFESENAGIDVRFNVYDTESYKRAIRNWLTGAPPDVVFWYAGNRMRQFVTPGLLEDVSDLYGPDERALFHASALELVSAGGRRYGVPYTYYQIGLYFRRDLLATSGIGAPPQTWSELLEACDRLRANGIEPFAIGTKELWPAAGWFDYIDLRSNGLAFHMDLMQGKIAYTDARVRDVFSRWRELLEHRCFSANHASSTWQENQALLYTGKAAMMLIGNFIVANFPAELRDSIDFEPFPSLRPDYPRYEDAPMNTLLIPARARNKDDARRFLRFVMRADVQEALNAATLQIPANLRAKAAPDRFIAKGSELLASADGLAQYFDRDTSDDLANIAMKGFQEFMLYPDRVDSILATIEQARKRVYGDVYGEVGDSASK